MRLGRLLLQDHSSTLDARRKVYQLALELQLDLSKAVQLATCISELGHHLIPQKIETKLYLLLEQHEGQDALTLLFSAPESVLSLPALRRSFDHVESEANKRNTFTIRAKTQLPPHPLLDNQRFLQQQMTLLQRQSRQQLLAQVQTKHDELQEYSVHLEEMVTQRTEALQEAIQRAEAATHARSTFLANMSHEIRTPLNGIIGFANLVSRTTMTPQQQNYIQKLKTSSHTLLNLINDILDFSKIEAGKLQLELVPFQLQTLLEELADLFAAPASHKEIEFLVSREQTIPASLIGDPLRLQQILINLTSNALKFTEKGHIAVRATMLAEAPAPDKVTLRLSVDDTGIGIPQDRQDDMFSSFTQADNSTTRKYGGTGLGLAICKQLTTLMGGTIGVQSTPGEGTTCWVEIPFALDISAPTEQPLLDLHGLKTLIVDDNSLSRQLLWELTHSFGLQPTLAEDGEAALLALHQAIEQDEPFALVLMDWRMPRLDGMETARTIRATPSLAATPIILLTAFGQEQQQQESAAIGLNAFLTKPVQQSVLFDTLMNVFSRQTGASRPRTQMLIEQDLYGEGLRGATILLAEDNLINQEVALGLLNAEGLHVDVANNGLEVLEMLKQRHYDAVLLDMQMPLLDGYSTARQIREDAQYDALPLIAMTAHAMTGDREKCLEAGMDDYVTKPIKPKRLFAVLQSWIKGKALSPPPTSTTPETSQPLVQQPGPASAPTDARTPAPLASGTLPPLQWFDTTDALHRLRGNEVLLQNLLQRLLDEHAQDHQHLQIALHKGDFAQAFQIAHNIKGIAGNLSSFRLQRSSADLESLLDTLCHGNTEATSVTIDRNAIDQLFDAFQADFTAAITELREKLPNATHPPPAVQREISDALASTESRLDHRHRAAIKELQMAAYIGDIDEVTAALESLPTDATETQECQQLLHQFDLDAINALALRWLEEKT